MPLIEKQINKLIERLTETAIQKGELPSRAILMNELASLSERVNGAPVFRPLTANRFKQFDVIAWNREMGNVEFDLKIVFEELISQAILLMKRTGWSDTVYRAQRGQLDRTIAALNDIIFTKQNTEDHFLGFSETFTDFSKIDLDNSTPGILSLSERALLIPSVPMGTKRIRLEDKIIETLSPIVVNSPSLMNVKRSVTAADAPFINIFQDMSVIWRHDVITKNDKGCEIQITFPIDNAASAYSITKVAITPTSESKMMCKILTSYDDSNFTLLPTPNEWMGLNQMATTTSIDFERINVKFIRIILKKDAADEIIDGNYRYSFGLRNFSIYSAARMQQAVYQTIVMKPQFETIEKVAIDTQDFTPAGCNIDYYVADETGDFLPIAPIGGASSSAPRVVRFGDMQNDWIQFDGSGEPAYTYNALDFFKINPIPVSGEVHFGMSKLYRGRQAWARETSVIEELQTARDTFIQFTKDDQKLYTYVDATVTGDDLIATDNTERTVLTVPSDDTIYYDRNIAGHLVRPNYGIDISTDEQPKYAIAEVLAIRNSYNVTGETFSLTSSQWVEFANLNLDEDSRPSVYWSEDNATWYGPITEDKSYQLQKQPGEGNYLTGKIKMIAGVIGSVDPLYGRVNYQVKKDITHLVRDIDTSKGQIWLAHPVSADKFIIRYRIVPDNLIRKSIVVTERRGDDQGLVYKEGSDYVINVSSGTITRLESSDMKSGGSCYVDYQWVDEKYSLETYSSWCYYDRSEPTVVKFSSPSIDKDNGETFYLDVNGGRTNLIEAGETPILSRGWYRFTVESKPVADTSSGIRKVLKLVDLDGDPIFSGTKYFSEIRAFRSPMNEVSESKLKFGTRKDDRSTFAIDTDGGIVVNFNPGSSSDITTLLYDIGSDSLIERDEHFELVRVSSSGKTAKGVRLRAILRRNPNVEPGTTPKCFGWSLRISR